MNKRVLERANPWQFFALALGISWFFWMWIVLFEWNVWSFPAVVFGGMGLFGPAFAEIIILLHAHDRERWRDYWQRVFDIKRIGKKWHLVIWFTFPVINGIAILSSILIGLPLPEFETAKRLLSEPWQILPFASFILLFGPLPEELGWRGYALDGLQARYNALVSSLILGIAWALWHIPLFFMQGTFQHDRLGFNTSGFWSYIYGPIIISIIFTWIYNNTNRSTLAAILFHFMVNFTGELMPLTGQSRIFGTMLVTGVSVVVIIIWGPETLTRHQDRKRGEKGSVKGKQILQGFFGRGICPYQLSFVLDSSLRRFILSPRELADRLHIKKDSRVLEVGPGSGYFSVEIARRIPRGHLELFDLQSEMLEKARLKIERAGLNNVGFTRGDAVNLPFKEGEFDIVFLVAVLGEVSDRVLCLRSIYRVLRPSGLLSITEQPGDPDFLPLSVVRSLAEEQGFEFIESYGRKKNYTANFIKPARIG